MQESEPMINTSTINDRPTMAEPMAMAHPSDDGISLDAVRSAMVANFEQDDLDIPAFLRKRGEVM
jgi:hypothetical protein